MDSGELCVELDSMEMQLTVYVGNWDTVRLLMPALLTGNLILHMGKEILYIIEILN